MAKSVIFCQQAAGATEAGHEHRAADNADRSINGFGRIRTQGRKRSAVDTRDGPRWSDGRQRMEDGMGRAEELFNRMKHGGAAEVHAMISAAIVEELFLDYKQSSTVLPANKLSDNDRKNLAKAIAGFGNSEGGVIVWGVDCRHTPHGDVPTKAVPITQPLALKTLFDGAIGGLTLPPHSGVENLSHVDAPADHGFVITYIPPGTYVPYQTLFPKQEYYIRAGSNFLPTPHGVLAGLFGRAPQPILSPIVRLGIVRRNDLRDMLLRLDVSVVNKGRGFAEDIFCIVQASWPRSSAVQYPFDLGNGRRAWRTTGDGQDCFTALFGDTLLPPGAQQTALSIHLSTREVGLGDYAFSVSFGCRGGAGAAQNIVLPGKYIDGAVTYYTGTEGGSLKAENERQALLFTECLQKQSPS
jgi:hypothetical protein